MKSLSITIVVGNDADVIGNCLQSCSFADEVIVYANSTDNTVNICQKILPSAKIIHNPQNQSSFDFSKAHNDAIKHTSSDWILSIDADERISSDLKAEILKIISSNNPPFTSYDIPRANFFLGKRVYYGGTYPDYVKRLFLKNSFRGYHGTIHEQPDISGSSSIIKSDLYHFTHRSLSTMLSKSLKWTDIEARLLFNTHHPPVVWWRFLRMMITKFWQRYIQQQMWRDGLVGLISVIFEMYDTYLIYARLYELQLDNA